jgi:Fe-S-cluster containining protein
MSSIESRGASIAGRSDDPPACELCAACCFGHGERYVRVTGDDHERLGSDAAALTRFIDHRCYMVMVDGRCSALARDPQSGRFSCGVYERRPAVCRELGRGTPQCEAERLRKAAIAAAWSMARR